MLVNFINSEELNNAFQTKLLYSYSEQYERVAKQRLNNNRIEGVVLSKTKELGDWATSKYAILKTIQRLLWFCYYTIAKYFVIYRNSRLLAKKFKEEKPDIIHINNGGYPASYSCISAVIAAKNVGINEIVYVSNNMAVDRKHPLRWFDYFLDRYMVRNVSVFVTGSNNASKRLKQVLSLSNDKLVVLRNGITKRPVLTDSIAFKKQNEISEDKLVFCTIANFEERKGHIYLLKSIESLKHAGKLANVMFLLEGNGPTKESIIQYIHSQKLEDVVKCVETKSIYDLYNASDVLILPSIANEDFPNVIIEGMGMGLPSIGTKIAGIPEQISDHVNGLLVEPKDVEGLSAAILEMIDNADLRKKCSDNVMYEFESKYTSDISVRNYMKLYNSLNIK